MMVTDVRIKVVAEADRLRAFASITIDGEFVVRDLKVISGSRGLFISMPSRKLADRCGGCASKCGLSDHFCARCGSSLDPQRALSSDRRVKLHADTAHPITHRCRNAIQEAVIAAYELELTRCSKPGYVCRYDDYSGETL